MESNIQRSLLATLFATIHFSNHFQFQLSNFLATESMNHPSIFLYILFKVLSKTTQCKQNKPVAKYSTHLLYAGAGNSLRKLVSCFEHAQHFRGRFMLHPAHAIRLAGEFSSFFAFPFPRLFLLAFYVVTSLDRCELCFAFFCLSQCALEIIGTFELYRPIQPRYELITENVCRQL